MVQGQQHGCDLRVIHQHPLNELRQYFKSDQDHRDGRATRMANEKVQCAGLIAPYGLRLLALLTDGQWQT
jgi:hypothetical protein